MAEAFSYSPSAYGEVPGAVYNFPPHNQEDFFSYWLRQGNNIRGKIRGAAGPFEEGLFKILRDTDAELVRLHPRLTPDHIKPQIYQPDGLDTGFIEEQPGLAKDVLSLMLRRKSALYNFGKYEIAPAIQDQQQLPVGLLARPPYCQMGEEIIDGTIRNRLCFNACWRMVFAGITGWKPREAATVRAALNVYNTYLPPEEGYLNIFRTALFRERTSVIWYMGADLAFIAKMCTSLQKRQPSVRVYCISQYQSSVSTYSNHTGILLGTEPTEGRVQIMDPSPYSSVGVDRFLSRSDFGARTAVALSAGYLVFALPPPGSK